MSSTSYSFVTSTDVPCDYRAVPYVMLTNTPYASSSGKASLAPGRQHKRVIIPLHAGDGSGYLRNHLQGIMGLPGCESALLGISRASHQATSNSTECEDDEHSVGGIRSYWGKHKETHASRTYTQYVLQNAALLHSDAEEEDDDDCDSLAGANHNHNNHNNNALLHHSMESGSDPVDYTVRVGSESAVQNPSRTSLTSSPDVVVAQQLQAAEEMEVFYGQTVPYTAGYVPASLPPSNAAAWSNSHESAKSHSTSQPLAVLAEEEFQCWASNTVDNMPVFPFPQISAPTLTSLATSLVKKACFSPNACTDMDVCGDAFGDPSQMKGLSEQERREHFRGALEIMTASAFLQM